MSVAGVLVQLRYPYPRGVSEPSIYLDANVLSDAECAEIEAKQKPAPKSNKASKFTTSLDLSVSCSPLHNYTEFMMMFLDQLKRGILDKVRLPQKSESGDMCVCVLMSFLPRIGKSAG